MQTSERSRNKINLDDLRFLASLARNWLDTFFSNNQTLRAKFGQKLIAITLCQGAAMHYVDGTTGVKDFDIYFFFSKYDKKLINRMPNSVECGINKFGLHPTDYRRGYCSRKVDLLRRSIDIDIVKQESGRPDASIKSYLKRGRTRTAHELSQKAVIGLWPKTILGKVIWP
jgi:hypothetical protein